ncbi:MAG TPA: alpha/beta hydrolase [Blastocatellia bacterium]|nr:alpha/beta hydrolase [Blastocatellia bacterium]
MDPLPQAHPATAHPASSPDSPRTPQYRIEGSGPLLVYVAGLDGTGELFFKQAPALARSFRVVTYASRGGGGFTYDDLTADLANIIRDSREEKATVLGESFGGTVALSFALGYPELLERLVIVNSFPRFRGRVRIKLAGVLAKGLPFRALRPARVAASLLGLYLDGVGRADRQRFFEAIRSVNGEGYARRLELIAELDIEKHLSQIKTATLFIAGERDLLIPSAREARSMAARMPNAQVRTIPGAGHACLLGDRVRVAEILPEWIGS